MLVQLQPGTPHSSLEWKDTTMSKSKVKKSTKKKALKILKNLMSGFSLCCADENTDWKEVERVDKLAKKYNF